MCGICGIIHFDKTQPISESVLKGMNDIIFHRGPDEEGVYLNQNVGLAMRRLSIIDLSTGQQPMFNEDGSVAIVFNGEIYNYLELRDALIKLGHKFVTNCDTETIVHAYEQWGDSCPEKLRGMFVFAIWDARSQKLFIARDRLGKKPLYYYRDNQRLIFASEIKALLNFPDVPRRLDLQALDAYLSLGYVPAPRTMFADISKLPAGHSLSMDGNTPQIREYWDLSFNRSLEVTTLEETREQVRHHLEEAVRIRLMSDVPLGAFLSGGIDSSMVVALMSKFLNRPVDTFSVGFEEEEHNELSYARMAAQHLNTNHHEIMVNTCSPDLLSDIVWHMDEPVSDPAAVPTYMVSKLARQYVTVVLTGEGGDEVFAGYDYYKMDRWAQGYQRLFGASSQRALPFLARTANAMLRRPRYHPRTIWHWSLPEQSQFLAWMAIQTDNEKDNLYNPEYAQYIATGQASTIFARLYENCQATDRLHRIMYVDTKLWLPDDLLMKVDKMSMAHSIEARAPLLDHHMMEFVASLATTWKLNGANSKFILKQVANELLPAEIVNRPKHTFDVPIGKWLKTSLCDLTMELISEGQVAGEKLFDPNYIMKNLWPGVEANRPGYSQQVWTLVNLALWAERYQIRIVH